MDIISRVVYFSRHKYIYGKSSDMDIFYDTEKMVKLDSIEPVVVNVINEGLDDPENYLNGRSVSNKIIKDFHKNYYDYLIALSIVDTLIENVDNDILNNRLRGLFQYFERLSFGVCKVDNIEQVRLGLAERLYYYKEEYYNYLANGTYINSDGLYIRFNGLENFINILRNDLGIDNHFSIMLDCTDTKNMSKMSIRTINTYMNMDCNNIYSMNVLCNNTFNDFIDLNNKMVGYNNNCVIYTMEQYKNHCNNVDVNDYIKKLKKNR